MQKQLALPTIFYFEAVTDNGKKWDEREMLKDSTMTPWQRLKRYCEENKTGIRSITVRLPGKRVSYKQSSVGYVTAYALSASLTIPGQHHLARGVGYIQQEDNAEETLNMMWFGQDGRVWQEAIPASKMAPHTIRRYQNK